MVAIFDKSKWGKMDVGFHQPPGRAFYSYTDMTVPFTDIFDYRDLNLVSNNEFFNPIHGEVQKGDIVWVTAQLSAFFFLESNTMPLTLFPNLSPPLAVGVPVSMAQNLTYNYANKLNLWSAATGPALATQFFPIGPDFSQPDQLQHKPPAGPANAFFQCNPNNVCITNVIVNVIPGAQSEIRIDFNGAPGAAIIGGVYRT